MITAFSYKTDVNVNFLDLTDHPSLSKVCFLRTINIIKSSIIHGSENVLAGSEHMGQSNRGEILLGR